MTPERWQQVKQIFQAVLDCPPEERDAFLERACQEDHVLRGEIESLISSYDHAGTQSIEDMAAQVATEVITDDERNLIIGRKIAHYEVVSHLGRGGMGEVYLAQDSRLGRKVALKFLPANLSAEDRARKRLIKEAQAAAKLDHPNICTIYEVGQQDGLDFIAMQYVEGETLACRIQRKPLEIKEVLDIAAQVADALAEAHSRAIIHRDIKPANIMMTTRRQVKVMDFGLAKSIAQRVVMDREAQTETLLSEPGMILGTLPYMSPEQVSGEPVDARSDIFSFGVMLYEMASGHKPFAAESAAATISAILTREAAPLIRYSREAPGELERIVAKALRKDREERYQGIKDMALDLKNLKEQLEFEAKLERSRPPDVNGEGGGISTAGSRLTAATSPELPASTGETGGSKSGAKLFTKPVIQHKRAAVGALALVLTVSTAAFFYFNYFNRAQALTEKDTILLADIVNMTGDTVFDGTLKQALEVQLGQSPFLNLFPEDRVRETLSYMGRSPDDRVTKQIAREICQRQGLKALLTGSIAALGSHYVVTLEALNSLTGEAIAREQVEAESKEQVLKTLGGAATKLREKLGESVSSIQKFDAPVEQATTSSLEALKAFTLGNEMLSQGRSFDAIPFFKRAVELDPYFALAYLKLGGAHDDIWKDDLAAEYAERAFELRGRTSEREQLYISNFYYAFTTGEIDKSIEVLELWKHTYPRDIKARTNLTDRYAATGQYDKAAEEAGEALRLDPNEPTTYSNLGFMFLCLNRFDEARAIFELALEKKLDSYWLHAPFYMVAFVQGDEATMQRQVDWANGKSSEGLLNYIQAHAAAFSGQRRKSQELFRLSKEANERYGLKEGAAWGQADYALLNAAFGDCQQTKEGTVNALNIVRSKEALMLGGVALALCGETSRAQSLASELVKRYPKDSLVNTTWLPTIQAALEINRGNTQQAIQLLQAARRFEMEWLGRAWPEYVRGLAYLRAGAGAEAMAEFQKIIDHRGVVAIYASYPLAHLGLARAAALTGDTAKSRKAYEDFFALWKDADPDLSILIEAKKEYEKLR